MMTTGVTFDKSESRPKILTALKSKAILSLNHAIPSKTTIPPNSMDAPNPGPLIGKFGKMYEL
jgi:hypothetical protein